MPTPTPYFDDGTVTLYLGDCREIVPALAMAVDAIVTDIDASIREIRSAIFARSENDPLSGPG